MTKRSESDQVFGHTRPGFESVADAFRSNFENLAELGAAVCVIRRGETVVDLWGGDRRPGQPWMRDTRVPVYSVSKGLVAIAAAVAISRGHFNYDTRICEFWPAFTANGKSGHTVRDILDHKAGLVLFDKVIDRKALADSVTMSRVLQDMTPRWPRGDAWGYHLATFGPLMAEIVRRTDPRERTLSRFFHDEVATPLKAAVTFGLDDTITDKVLAEIALPLPMQVVQGLFYAPFSLQRQALNPFSLLHATIREIADIDMNDRGWLANEFPSANGIAEARAIAAIYAAVFDESNPLKLSPAVLAQIVDAPRVPKIGDRDRTMGIQSRWHLGFVRPTPDFAFSASPKAFGMPGIGGAFGFYDPEQALAYAYTPNRMGVLPFNDPRETRLRKAVYACIGRNDAARAA